MSSKRVVGFIVTVLFLTVAMTAGANAQTAGTGFVVGSVTDPAKAAIVGASVTLTDVATNAVRTATTNDTGRYSFPNVPPGRYTVTINKQGFRQVKFTDQEVVVGEPRTLDATLEIGTSTEIVEVMATNTELQTMNATIGTTVTGLPLESLPTLGRDVSTFVALQPGVTPEGSVAGAVYDQNSFQLDGGNNSSDMDGSQNVYTPSAAGDPTGGLTSNIFTGNPGGGPTGVMPTPVDSIEEFKVGTSNQTADFNGSAGAEVQMVTKRGTDTWHGTAYEYYLDNHLNANTWDNNANIQSNGKPVPRPSFHYNRFGASGGGDLGHKEILGGKWYFFGNYEGFRWKNSATVTKAVPSAAMEQGILQFVTKADADGNPTAYSIYNLNPNPVTYTGPTTEAGLTSGTQVPSAICPAGPCDPRGLGISPTVQAMWTQYMPASNVSTCGGLSRCDHLNVQAFRANMIIPWSDDFGVARLDHDFGQKWHFSATYHYYKLERATTNQVDIGGFFPGDKLGVPSSISNRPQVPWYLTGAVTTNITSNLTNDFHYSYLRNYWARASKAQPPQIDGLAGAMEPFGESSTNVLAPYNLDTQNVRTRFWDGQDNMFRDDVTWIKGTHFFQFGGTYQRNFNYHQRTDNGGGINYQTVYQMGSSASYIDLSGGYVPQSLLDYGTGISNYTRDYAIVMGIPSVTQIAYTRTGKDLQLNPPLTPAYDKSVIPYYNLYFSDSWKLKPTFTLSYGLGWTVEMPPVEEQGKQVVVTNYDGTAMITENYLNQREKAAEAGQVFNPTLGFALLGNVTGHPKYLYNPFYGGFSPRIAAAWNPSYDDGLLGAVFGRSKTVIRGGYSVLYGRLNGVDLVLAPLLGTGLIQAVQCFEPLVDGTCPGSGATPVNAFRLGPTAGGWNGLTAPLPAATPTLPQPLYPGLNGVAAGAGEGVDPNFKPSRSQQYNLTVQRQINSKTTLEVGYIGRKLTQEYQPININAVPYMMNVGGQSFAKAYGQMVWQYCGGGSGLAAGNCGGLGYGANVSATTGACQTPGTQTQFICNPNALTPQPFFESALGGTSSAYCSGYASCTAAVAAKEGMAGTQNIPANLVWSLYSDLDNGKFTYGRSMLNTPINCPTGSEIGCQGQLTSGIGMNTTLGYSNYNGAIVTLKMADYHGLTMQSSFTYGKSLGTGATVQATSSFTVPNAYNMRDAYGLQNWDRKYVWNLWFVYQPRFFKDQHGFVGRVAGGWTLSPILTMGSGLPIEVYPTDNWNGPGAGQGWGQADGSNFTAYEQAVNMCKPGIGGSSRHNNPSGQGTYGSNGYGPGMFQEPAAVYGCFRNPILGIDPTGGGGAGVLRGQMYWNMDLSLKKQINITERVSTEFTFNLYNVFNHPQLYDPYLALGDQADWGAMEGQVNSPRAMQFGLRLRF